MVTGLNIFRDYFVDDTDKYVLIGGAACDIVFTSNDATFRATKTLDSRCICGVLRGQIYPDVSACYAIISESKYVDSTLLGCF